ncbi:DinB family protein [Oceanobacillus arenosus]|uniref:DinB family protein n=1 Tax=Oceanobacillus arenosus TaxID=1229153 RepID=A0A3D8PQX9_9BACI|nr:DinB family protein [Oceanobacillus arenosus]RDW17569.1 DinB family protein [Oceanobacillus arenosus]
MSKKQFNLTRTSLLTFIQDLDENTADIQAKYFNNTIRWHLGHVLVFTEKFLFIYPKKSEHFPKEYAELFSSGTKPADWTMTAPTLEELTTYLVDQQERVNQFDELFWKTNVPFKVPFGHIESYEDLLIMIGHHEAEHLGKIKAMRQVVEAK